MRSCWFFAALLALAVPRAVGAEPPRSGASVDAELARRVDRERLIRIALERNPGLRAGAQRARALKTRASAASRLPDPEAMLEVTQVPFERPNPANGMVMVGVFQRFPAPGSLSARQSAGAAEAAVQEAATAARTRELIRDVEHAFIDYREATERLARHAGHRALARRTVRAAEARLSAGGRLSDVTQAQTEAARIHVEIATDGALVRRARARLNALLARRLDAPLAAPAPVRPMTVREGTRALLALARQRSPELRAARAAVDARRAELRALDREATWPAFSLGVLYYPPTEVMADHGYGVAASASLPWIWGSSERRRRAEAELARASGSDAEDVRYRLNVEIGGAEAAVRAAEARLSVLEGSALPAAQRALEVAFSGYSAGADDLLGVLRAQTSVVDTEIEIIAGRAALEHALVDLDWAVGTRVARTPFNPRKGGDHGGE